ncbi:uncharacterized [Tachysurus ichikawai]
MSWNRLWMFEMVDDEMKLLSKVGHKKRSERVELDFIKLQCECQLPDVSSHGRGNHNLRPPFGKEKSCEGEMTHCAVLFLDVLLRKP